jgi:hypothetical protein
MRTLQEIDDAIFKAAEKAAENDNIAMTPEEVIRFHSELAYGDKYREMYALLKEVERYLEYDPFATHDGVWRETYWKKKLKGMINAL